MSSALYSAVIFCTISVVACPGMLLASSVPDITTAPSDAEAAATRRAEAPAATQPVPAQGDQLFGLKSKTMLGDWLGAGPIMRDWGIGANYFWQSHFMSNMAGGKTTGSLKHSSTSDLLLTFDLDKMGVIPGGDVLVHGRQQWGAGVNPWTASTLQIDDDSDGDRGIYVDQLWYRQQFLEKKIALQVGYLDYQTIVDRNAFANTEDKQFQNEALDNNPLFPTAGATGLGAAAYLKPCEWYTLIVGAGDAERLPLYKPGFSTTFHGHAYFLAWIENNFNVKIPSPRGPLAGTYRVGTNYDPLPRSRFISPDLPPDRQGDHWNLYMSHDQMLYRENPKDSQGWGVFFRYAYNDSDTYRYNQFWSAGTVYTGLLPTRDADALGFGFAQLMSSRPYRHWKDKNSAEESIYELYYAIQITPWVVISPNIEYVDNPGGNDTVAHAIAGGLRVRITF